SGIAREMRESVSSENERLSKQLEEDLSRKAAEAEARIQASRDAAMANVTEIAAEAAEAIVVRITGQAPDRARTEAAVASALN
ncbi:MAG: F0F1 ATP synthase subunit B', partial [Pseudomonadota bacterium]